MDTNTSAQTQSQEQPVEKTILSPSVLAYLDSYRLEDLALRQMEGTSNIQVSRAASALAVIYERIRQVIDYQDEVVLRRKAIERILLRRITASKSSEQSIAEGLIREITWAHYIDNNVLPPERVDQVAEIIKRYKVLLETNTYKQTNKLPDLRDWILGVMSSEIEQLLVPHFTTDALVNLMYESLDTSGNAFSVDEATKNLQVFLTVHRTLLKSDKSVLRYHLLNSYYPDWQKNNLETTQQVADQFIQLVTAIDYHLKHPLGEKLFPIIRKQTAPFTILKAITDIYRTKSNDILAITPEREEAIKTMCNTKYQDAKARIQRAAVRSIIYLFITKITLALLLEVPADRILYGEVHFVPLLINVLFPPLLMFLIAVTIRVPNQKNTDKIIKRLGAVIEDPDGRNAIKLTIPDVKPRSPVYIYFYLAMFVVSFGLISWLLSRINFNFVSGTLFFFFTCLVSFFAFRIRQTARELVMVDQKESFLSSIADLFFLPFLRVGRALSNGFSKINIFIFIFDFILEAPLKSLISVAEEWFTFIREKKDEIV
ncbi:MAG: hypothetical protein M3P33_04225 [bacterium]|nr:hypothetical protein [bacterium]